MILKRLSVGAGQTATDVEQAIDDVDRAFRNSVTLDDRYDVSQALKEAVAEHNAPGWSEAQGSCVMVATVEHAECFIRALPPEVASPEVGVDANARLVFEWYGDKSNAVAVSIDESAMIYFAAVVDGQARHSRSFFCGEIPAALLSMIEEVRG